MESKSCRLLKENVFLLAWTWPLLSRSLNVPWESIDGKSMLCEWHSLITSRWEGSACPSGQQASGEGGLHRWSLIWIPTPLPAYVSLRPSSCKVQISLCIWDKDEGRWPHDAHPKVDQWTSTIIITVFSWTQSTDRIRRKAWKEWRRDPSLPLPGEVSNHAGPESYP